MDGKGKGKEKGLSRTKRSNPRTTVRDTSKRTGGFRFNLQGGDVRVSKTVDVNDIVDNKTQYKEIITER